MTYWLITKDNWFGVSTVDSNFKSSEGESVQRGSADHNGSRGHLQT